MEGAARYIVFKCSKCGRPSAAKLGQRSRTCPFCGARNDLSSSAILAKAASREEVSAIILRLRGAEGSRRRRRV